MARFTNSNTETYRNVDIDTTYFSDGSYEITIDGENILQFDSVDQAKAYIDAEYLKYPYISLAIDMYNYEKSYLWDDSGMNIFDIAKDIDTPESIAASRDYFETEVGLSDTETQADVIQVCNDILDKVYAIRDYKEKPSYYTSEGLTAALIGIKEFSDFEPTSEGLIDILEYFEKIAFIHGYEYSRRRGHIPTFEEYQESWDELLADGQTPEEVYEYLYTVTTEIDF